MIAEQIRLIRMNLVEPVNSVVSIINWGNRAIVQSKVEKEMAEAMDMTPDEFKKKLKKSTDHAGKKKKDDSAENKKEIKKLQKQVKEMQEAQVAQREKSDTDSDVTKDSGWGSDGDANRSGLCERVYAPKEAFTAHNSGTCTNGEASQTEGCDFETTTEGCDFEKSSLASGTLTRATVTILRE